MKKQKGALPPEDDGRVIANMNVEGMPWYQPEAPKEEGRRASLNELDRREMRSWVWGAMKAGLLMALVFSAFLVLFTLFCTKVWLR